MILEYADDGTLFEHLRKNFDGLTWKTKYKLALDITNGLMYLHKLEIIHKDLAARNVLLKEDLTAKVSDFGLSRKVEGDQIYVSLGTKAV